LTAETRKGAQATLEQAQADQQAESSAEAVANAVENLHRAREDYAAAVASTKNQIREAQAQEAESLRELTRAHDELKEAATDAYEEMARAALEAADAVLQVQSAQLGIERSRLSIRRARLELAQFRKQADIGASSLDNLFQRATDVTIDPSQARKAIGQILKAGDDLSGEDQLRLEELILNLKEAKLQEKEATNGLKRAQLDENESRRQAAEFAKKGILASDSYKGAIERLREAQLSANRARQRANELEQRGITNSPAVIAAARGIADAEQQVANAKDNQRLVNLQLKAQQEQQLAQTEKYNEERKKLSATEQRVLDAIDKISSGLRSTLGPATDEVLGGLLDALDMLGPAFAGAGGLFEELGKAWRGVITQFSKNLLRPDNIVAIKSFFEGSIQLSKVFGSILTDVFNIFANIAQAAMPLLLSLLADLAVWLDGLARKTENIRGINEALKPMVEALKLFIGIIIGLGAAIVNIFRAGEEPINAFLTRIKEAIDRFNEFLQSEEGRKKVKQFFERTLPMVESFFKWISKAFGSFLKFLELIAPFLEPVLNTLAALFEIVGDIFGTLSDVLQVLMDIVEFVTTPMRVIKGIIKEVILTPLRAARDLFKSIFGWVEDLIDKIKGIKWPKLPSIPDITPWKGLTPFAKGGVVGLVGEAGPEAVLPLNNRVLGALGRAIVGATAGMLPSTSGRMPRMGLAGAGGGSVIHENHFHIPSPLDATRAIDPENTAALLQQAWERRGGGLS
jgi:hypothetical protein